MNRIIGSEIVLNLDRLAEKLDILTQQPIVYHEPLDSNDKAIDRLERAKNLAFESISFDANRSRLSTMDTGNEIAEFYKSLRLTRNVEDCTIAVSTRERQFRSIMGMYAWQRVALVQQLYVILSAYGSELLTDDLHYDSPAPPATFVAQINEEKNRARQFATRIHKPVLRVLNASLSNFELGMRKCEEYKTASAPAGRDAELR